jgi:DNA-directed RNA polymerase subunit RPC12/RpoP
MQICLECGKTFEDDEIECWQESRGEFWGEPAYENMSGCPHCGGAYEEAYECENCGEYFTLDELDENHLCEDCREDEEEEE